MMTIKEFAALCNCNAQTLRYYDKIDLLKPVKVDPWSKYRYYTRAQAVDFVKIKNLQSADFSIEEIRKLITLSDQQVYEAFSRKIAEQEQKLDRIRKIQLSYLTEINTMKKLIDKVCCFLLENAENMDRIREFGLESNDIPRLVAAVRRKILEKERENKSSPESITLQIRDEVFTGEEAVENLLSILETKDIPGSAENMPDQTDAEETEPDGEILWQRHGWEHIHEFIDEIPHLASGTEYCLRLRMKDWDGDLAFPMFMIGAMILKGHDTEAAMSCSAYSSKDGVNHFELIRKP